VYPCRFFDQGNVRIKTLSRENGGTYRLDLAIPKDFSVFKDFIYELYDEGGALIATMQPRDATTHSDAGGQTGSAIFRITAGELETTRTVTLVQNAVHGADCFFRPVPVGRVPIPRSGAPASAPYPALSKPAPNI
jgi:hypothetical protein